LGKKVCVVLQLLKGHVLELWALIVQFVLSDDLCDLIWGVIRNHKLAMHAFVPVTLVQMCDICVHKEALFISVDIITRELTMAYTVYSRI